MPGAPLGLNSVVAPSEDLVSSDLDGEVVMMSIENGKYYGLDDICSRIWALLGEPRKVSELCVTLMEEFEVSREQCEADVLVFLNDMAGDNLIHIVPASAP